MYVYKDICFDKNSTLFCTFLGRCDLNVFRWDVICLFVDIGGKSMLDTSQKKTRNCWPSLFKLYFHNLIKRIMWGQALSSKKIVLQTNWLIDCCSMLSELYFTYIHDENISTKVIKMGFCLCTVKKKLL
jgi:hypothetical protein